MLMISLVDFKMVDALSSSWQILGVGFGALFIVCHRPIFQDGLNLSLIFLLVFELFQSSVF